MTEPHPFAQYVQTIARGPNLSRPLTEEEMAQATNMILDDQVDPLQMGAFLCVLRVRTEDPGETAGFVRVVKERIVIPKDAPDVDLDWSSYAGKKRQLPWFLLSALLLADNGIKVFMHGTEGHTEGRLYSRDALSVMGIGHVTSMEEAASQIRERNFSYLPLQYLMPKLQDIMDLKPILGVRTPINTFTRMLNPFNAPYSLQSVFHPNYAEVHREASILLKQPHMAVFKGEGGEGERRPAKPVVVESLHDGVSSDEEWPAMLPGITAHHDEEMNPDRLLALWRGKVDDQIGTAAVIGTTAIALRLMGRAGNPIDAIKQATEMWKNRAGQPLNTKNAA